MIRKRTLSMLAILLTTAVVLQFCGCAPADGSEEGSGGVSGFFHSLYIDLFGEPEQEYTELKVPLPRHAGYAPIDDKHGYAALKSDEEREAYLSMEQSLFRLTAEEGGEHGLYQLCRARIPSLESVQIFKVKEALRADHPEAFWMCGDYSLGRNLRDGLYVTLYSSMSAEEIQQGAEALAGRVSAMLREIPSGRSEYERELIIHDMIVRDVEYDHAAADNLDLAPEAASVYGALVDGLAVCTGYSFAAKLMLNRVGVSCMVVDGKLRENPDDGHMWNIVSVEDEWYHLDITNNDPTGYAEYNIRSYNYFNLTDKDIAVSHELAPDFSRLTESTIQWGEDAFNIYNFPLPDCDSYQSNYYKLNAGTIDRLNYDGQTVMLDYLRKLSLTRDDMFYIIFPEDMESGIIEEWFKSFVPQDISTVNRENAQAGTGYVIDSFTYAQGAVNKWCNVYLFKLLYAE